MREEHAVQQARSIATTWSRLADFVVTQISKTVERPSRIFLIAGNLLLRLSGSSAGFIVRHVPPKWLPAPVRSTAFFMKGNRLLDANQPRAAWEAFQHCLKSSQTAHHYSLPAVCLAQGLGRFHDYFMKLYARANELRWQHATELGVANNRYRVLDNFWAANFGHTATLDYVIKLGILEGRSLQDTILYLPEESPVANPFLLEQFRPLLRLIHRRADLPFPEAAVEALQFGFLGPRRPDGTTVFFWELAAQTYRRWHEKGWGPLLTLPSEVEERGRLVLAAAGVPRDAWFVGLHVREGTSNRSHRHLHDVLNARIADYLPAIAEVTRRGGWVVRMGDPSMAKLPPLPNTLDYCHSALRSDWMDVFLAAKCRFFIGTSSGPAYVPPLYGVPSVLTNWWPPGQRPWHPGDIFVPKTYRRLADLGQLSLAETLVEPFGWCNSVSYLESSHGVMVEDNDPEDIRAAVVEMCEFLHGTAKYDEQDLILRQRADQICESGGAHGMARLARNFLHRRQGFVS